VEQIAYALHQIKSCHPLLKAHIEKKDGCLFFVSSQQDCDREIALEVKKTKIDCEEHMDTKFNCAEGDFLRIIISNAVHNNGKNESSFELVTILYHGICDAISVRDLHHQIINQFGILNSASVPSFQNISPMPIPVPAALSAERALNDSRKSQGFIVRGSPIDTPSPPLPQLDQAPVWCDPIAGDVNARSRTIKHAFTVEQTQQFQIACKVNKTTMHGLIGAASLIAVNCGTSTKRVLCSAVDLRRRVGLSPSDLLYAVGGFDGSAAFEYEVDANIELWALARKVRCDIVESIDSGRLLSTYTESVDGLVDAYKAGYLEGGTFGTVFLSNVGNENYTKNIGPLRWSEFEYIYGQFIPGGPHFHITASTFDGSLALNVMFVSSVVPEHVAHAFVEAVVGILLTNMSC